MTDRPSNYGIESGNMDNDKDEEDITENDAEEAGHEACKRWFGEPESRYGEIGKLTVKKINEEIVYWEKSSLFDLVEGTEYERPPYRDEYLNTVWQSGFHGEIHSLLMDAWNEAFDREN